MTATPPELTVLLGRAAPLEVEAAWSALLDRYSRLLLKAVGTLGGNLDARMDRYGHVLEELRRDDFRRLRAYRATAESSFGGWLLVVARRIALDYERGRYGRGDRGTASETSRTARAARRRLVELVGSAVDLEALPQNGTDPATALADEQVHQLLALVLDGLDARDRLLVRLRFDDGVAVRDIAAIMGFPTVFHVYHRLRWVLDQMRTRLIARGIDGANP
jgi:RNA polymerase sigma factor (sigma-70 family)